MKKIEFLKSNAGRNAYKLSKVWRLGFHIFLNGENLVFRLCYLRDKERTYYIQISKKVREQLECSC